MITFKKGDWVKYIDPSSTLIDVLKSEGWKAEGDVSLDVDNQDTVDKPRRGRPPKNQGSDE